MDRELDGNAAGVADAVAHPAREIDVVAVAGREVAAGLGDADDRPATVQLGQGQAEVHVAFEVERRHRRIARRIEPLAAAQAALLVGFRHVRSSRFLAPTLACYIWSDEYFSCRCLALHRLVGRTPD